MNRYKRIARDLELLPRELHEPILADLRAVDIVNLVLHAGTSLMISIRASAAWRPLWREDGAGFVDMCTLAHGSWSVLLKHPWLKRHFLDYEFYHSFSSWSYDISKWFVNHGTKFGQILRATAAQLSALQDLHVQPWRLVDSGIRCVVSQDLGTLMGRHREEAFLKYYEVHASVPWPENTPRRHDPGWEEWTAEQLDAYVSRYFDAQRHWNTSRSQQLLQEARLCERFPDYVRTVLAPPQSRQNRRHAPDTMRRWAKKVLRAVHLDRPVGPGDNLFRYVHPHVVPCNWTLRLWARAAALHPESIGPLESTETEVAITNAPVADVPPEIRDAMATARQGMQWYFTDCSQCVETPPSGRTFYPCRHCHLYTPFRDLSRLVEKDGVPVFAVSQLPALARVSRRTKIKPKIKHGQPPQRRSVGRHAAARARKAALEKTLAKTLTRREYKDYRRRELADEEEEAGTISGAFAPADEREIQWLEAYLTTIEWIQKSSGVTLDEGGGVIGGSGMETGKKKT